MASGILMGIMEEVTCPICLELLTEPLTLDCSHSFCQTCITASKEFKIGQEGESRCPVCRIPYQPGNLQPNWPMANIVERLREVKLRPEEENKKDLCVRHEKKLLLFCQEDGKVLCWLCERSQEHRGHHTFLVDEVAQEYQEKLQAALERLRKEQGEAERLEADVREERTSWKDVNGILKRSETWTLKEPKMVSKKLKCVFRVPDLSGMLQEFKELTEIQCYWVDVMLNPVNSIPDIVVSADRRQVRATHRVTFKNTNSHDFVDFDVLGHQCFSSGKYYWEVDVSEKTAWILGVYSKERNLNRKYFCQVFLLHSVNHPNAYSRYRPQYGYWVIGLRNGSEYIAFEDTPISDPNVLTLSMTVLPRRVGVFLDYEAGTVSFINVTNHGSLIYKFSKLRFSQTVSPYFNPWNCPGPITLCPPSS